MYHPFADIYQLRHSDLYSEEGSGILSTNWSKLMKLTLAVKSYPQSMNLIRQIIRESPGEINKKNSKGVTALNIAALNCNSFSSIECVKLLIDNGATLNEKDTSGYTILMGASRYANTTSSIECVKLLINSGANVNDENNWKYTSLMYAVKNANTTSNIECVQLLLDLNADVNKKDDMYNTSLMIASEGSNFQCVKLLLNHGANVNDVNIKRMTSLLFASMCSDITVACEIIKLLIEYGANVDNKDDDGWTSLMYLLTRELNITDNDIIKEVIMMLIHMSKSTICDKNKQNYSAYDYYKMGNRTFLSEDQLGYLDGTKVFTMTKSARKNCQNRPQC